MDKQEQPFETRGHDLSGFASLDLYDKDSFNAFAARIAGYNPDRFDPVALKVFVQDRELIVTLYAVDKSKQEQSDYPPEKLPVKKFKIKTEWAEFLSHIRYFDLVVSEGAYKLEDMLVINK